MLTNDKQGDLFRAKQARDEGMARALDHAGRVCEGWENLAYDFLVRFAEHTSTFISEDVSDASKVVAFPQPPTDRAWGPIYRRAVKAGIIVKDGIGISRRRHASICPRWRSRVGRRTEMG